MSDIQVKGFQKTFDIKTYLIYNIVNKVIEV